MAIKSSMKHIYAFYNELRYVSAVVELLAFDFSLNKKRAQDEENERKFYAVYLE